MISLMPLFDCITRSLLLHLEDIKLIAIITWIFCVSGSFRLFMISIKYGLILLRYSSNDSVLFLSLLPSYSIQLLLQKLPALTSL